MAVTIEAEACTACGLCANVCPSEAITVTDVARVDKDKCVECGICVDDCPSEAIS